MPDLNSNLLPLCKKYTQKVERPKFVDKSPLISYTLGSITFQQWWPFLQVIVNFDARFKKNNLLPLCKKYTHRKQRDPSLSINLPSSPIPLEQPLSNSTDCRTPITFLGENARFYSLRFLVKQPFCTQLYFENILSHVINISFQLNRDHNL